MRVALLKTAHRQSYGPTTLAPYHSGGAAHVHLRVRRPHQRFARAGSEHFDDDEGPAHERQNEGRGDGHFLLGLSGAANSRRLAGVALERAKSYQFMSNRLGRLRSRVRIGSDVSAV